MTVSTDSLELVAFGRDVIKKKKALVERMGLVQRTASKEPALQVVVEERKFKSKSSVSASYALAAKLTESDKSLEASRAEVAALKEQVARTDTENVDSQTLVA